MAELAGFLVVAAVVICTPGQDTALTIRNALAGGRRSGLATALGVALGQAVWTIAAAAGLVAVLRASQPAFTALRLVGAAYLVYLGLQSLLVAVRRSRPHQRAVARSTPGGSLRQGLVSNLANPKMVVFFTSLLPQFGDAFGTLLALGLLFSLLTGLWLAAYAVAAARARRLLARDRIRRAFEAVTGVVLVAFGLRVAATRS
ncbi:MAG TPA: LysE family translocator [Gaiellaceae bacterium]|nr:LysE family translocator [Gaiellaceae bacterium]